jgi:hypothetical protein
MAAGFKGTWKAWLSSCDDEAVYCASGTIAANRLTHRQGPYMLSNGVIVANNWTDLTDGTISNPINIDEKKVNVGISRVATGTKYTGDSFHSSSGMGDDSGRYCYNWASTSGWSHVGYTNQVDFHWSSQVTSSCSTAGCGGGACNVANLKLYCLKQ